MWSPDNPASTVPPQVAGSDRAYPRVEHPLHGRAAPVPAKPGSQISILGKSLLIKGEVTGSEPLQIEGRIEGSLALSGNHVSIGRGALVAADIIAGEVAVRGTLRGNLTISDLVEIHSGGSVVGDIAARRINIEDGAHVQGSIDMRRPDPKAPGQQG